MAWSCAFNDKFWRTLNFRKLFWNTESDPYNKAFNRDSSPKVIIEGSVRRSSSWRFCISRRKNWQCKKKVFNCFDFSTTVTQGAYAIFELLTEFMLKSLNFCCSLLSSFTPIWSCISCKIAIFVLFWKTALTLIWIAW